MFEMYITIFMDVCHIFARCRTQHFVIKIQVTHWNVRRPRYILELRRDIPEMTQNKEGFVSDTQSKLLVPPHIVDKLIDLLIDDWQPTPFEQEQLRVHLSECSDCCIAFSILLVIGGEYEARKDHSEKFIQDFSTQFRILHEQMEARSFELLGAYAEKIVAEGQDKADKRFPILAEYIKRCPDCQLELEDTIDFLRQIGKDN